MFHRSVILRSMLTFFTQFMRPKPTPLCLFAIPRSGQNLLGFSLNAHPDVLIVDEPFDAGFSLDALMQNYATQKKIIGFKLSPSDVRMHENPEASWKMLEDIPHMKVITLKRSNHLDIAISLEQAEKKQSPREPIDLSFDTLKRRMDDIHGQLEEMDMRFRDHDMMRISYEQLVSNTDNLVRDIHTWLGIGAYSPNAHQKILKHRAVPRRMALKNYEELRTECALTHPEWLVFFDEPETLPGAHCPAPQQTNTR